MVLTTLVFLLLGTSVCVAQRRAANADPPVNERIPSHGIKIHNSTVPPVVNANTTNKVRHRSQPSTSHPQGSKGYSDVSPSSSSKGSRLEENNRSAPPLISNTRGIGSVVSAGRRQDSPTLKSDSLDRNRDSYPSRNEKGNSNPVDTGRREIHNENSTSYSPHGRPGQNTHNNNNRAGQDYEPRITPPPDRSVSNTRADRDNKGEKYPSNERDGSRQGYNRGEENSPPVNDRPRSRHDSNPERDRYEDTSTRYPTRDSVSSRDESFPSETRYDRGDNSRSYLPSNRNRPVSGAEPHSAYDDGKRNSDMVPEREPSQSRWSTSSDHNPSKGSYSNDRPRLDSDRDGPDERRLRPPSERDRSTVDSERNSNRRRFPSDNYPAREGIPLDSLPGRERDSDESQFDRKHNAEECFDQEGSPSRSLNCRDRRVYREDNVRSVPTAPPTNSRDQSRPSSYVHDQTYDRSRTYERKEERTADDARDRYDSSYRETDRYGSVSRGRRPIDERGPSTRSGEESYNLKTPYRGNPAMYDETSPTGILRPDIQRDKGSPTVNSNRDTSHTLTRGSDATYPLPPPITSQDGAYPNPSTDRADNRKPTSTSRHNYREGEPDSDRPLLRTPDDSRPTGDKLGGAGYRSEGDYGKESLSPRPRDDAYDERPLPPEDRYRKESGVSRQGDYDSGSLPSPYQRDEYDRDTSTRGTDRRRPQSPESSEDTYGDKDSGRNSEKGRSLPSSRRGEDSYDKGLTDRRIEDPYERRPPSRSSEDTYDRRSPSHSFEDSFDRRPPSRGSEDSYDRKSPSRGSEDSYDRRPPSRSSEGSYDRKSPSRGSEDSYDRRPPPSSLDDSYDRRTPSRSSEDSYDRRPPSRSFDDSYDRRTPSRTSEDSYDRRPSFRSYDDSNERRSPSRASEDSYRRPPSRSSEDSYDRKPPSRISEDSYDRSLPSRRSDDSYDRRTPPRSYEDSYDRRPSFRSSEDSGDRRRTEDAYERRSPSRFSEDTYDRGLSPPKRSDGREGGRAEDSDGRAFPSRDSEDAYRRRYLSDRRSEGDIDRDLPPARIVKDRYDGGRTPSRSSEDTYERGRLPARRSEDPYERGPPPARRSEDPYIRESPSTRRSEDSYERRQPSIHSSVADDYNRGRPPASRFEDTYDKGRPLSSEDGYDRGSSPAHRLEENDRRQPPSSRRSDERYEEKPIVRTPERPSERRQPPLSPEDNRNKGHSSARRPEHDISSPPPRQEDNLRKLLSSSAEGDRNIRPPSTRRSEPDFRSPEISRGPTEPRTSSASNTGTPYGGQLKGSGNVQNNYNISDTRVTNNSHTALKGDPDRRRLPERSSLLSRKGDLAPPPGPETDNKDTSLVTGDRKVTAHSLEQNHKGVSSSSSSSQIEGSGVLARRGNSGSDYKGSVPVFKSSKEIIDSGLHLRNPSGPPNKDVVTEVHYPVYVPRTGEDDVVIQPKDRRGTTKDT